MKCVPTLIRTAPSQEQHNDAEPKTNDDMPAHAPRLTQAAHEAEPAAVGVVEGGSNQCGHSNTLRSAPCTTIDGGRK